MDGFDQDCSAGDVPVVSTAFLPELIGPDLLARGEKSQTLWIAYLQVLYRRASHRLLDGLKDGGDGILLSSRMHDQMHVIRHEDIRPKIELVFTPRTVDCVDKPEAGQLSGQKRVALVATERQLMRMTGPIPSLASFGVPLPV
jgi:hypothetical protein